MEDRAKSIFLTAGMYSKAAHHMNGEASSDPSLLIPSLVNAALALELYFKSLYFIEKKCDFKVKGRHSHDFHALFNNLSREAKDMLIHQFKAAILSRDMSDVAKIEREIDVEIPRDLKGNLQSWSGVFTKVRYVYDKPKHAVSMMFFPEIEQVVRNTVISLKPDFRS